MRVLVCGGRDFGDRERFIRAMDEHVGRRSVHFSATDNWLPSDIHIIAGGARGADTLAIDWAVVNGCGFTEYPADWKTHGKKAGMLRNQRMINEGRPDLVVAFPGGRGTADMVRRAKANGIEVVEIS